MMRLSHLFKYRYIQVLTHHQFIQQKSSYYTYFYVCNRKINGNWHWYCGDPKKKEWCQSILAIAAATGINGGVISQKMRIAYSSSNVDGRRRSTNGRRTNRHRIRTDGTAAAAAATCVCTNYYILLTQCACYAQICVEMHTSLCTPISWDLMLDPCEWFSKSLSRRLKPQLTSLLGVRVCSTYCVCVTVVSQLTKSIKIYILIYISCMYIYMLGQKTWNISNHADPIEVVTKNEDIIADQNASG